MSLQVGGEATLPTSIPMKFIDKQKMEIGP